MTVTDPTPNLVGFPTTKAQFEASAKFCRKMAAKTLDGDTKVREPEVIAEAYIAKAEHYERIARGME